MEMLKTKKDMPPVGYLVKLTVCQETFQKATSKIIGAYVYLLGDNETNVQSLIK